MPSVCCLHEVISDWSGILTKNIAGSSGIELPILFASIESIDTFVSIDDFDTFSIVSPITTVDINREQVVRFYACIEDQLDLLSSYMLECHIIF
jgi:hypothetical protein